MSDCPVRCTDSSCDAPAPILTVLRLIESAGPAPPGAIEIVNVSSTVPRFVIVTALVRSVVPELAPKPSETGDTAKVLSIAAFTFKFPDRKSTRLNSSHVKISYAVFCLKKKKIQTVTSMRTLLLQSFCAAVSQDRSCFPAQFQDSPIRLDTADDGATETTDYRK